MAQVGPQRPAPRTAPLKSTRAGRERGVKDARAAVLGGPGFFPRRRRRGERSDKRSGRRPRRPCFFSCAEDGALEEHEGRQGARGGRRLGCPSMACAEGGALEEDEGRQGAGGETLGVALNGLRRGGRGGGGQ